MENQEPLTSGPEEAAGSESSSSKKKKLQKFSQADQSGHLPGKP